MYHNAKNVGYYMIGEGALSQLTNLLMPRRDAMPDAPAIFFIDRHFEGKNLIQELPIQEWDQRLPVDTASEPTCESVDKYAGLVKEFLNGRTPAALIAVGGGSTMDTCKCVGNLLTNPGSAADYQGEDLVKNPAPYKVAVPTISGSGSESSRTAFMLDKQKLLRQGMTSDYSMFDQILLDSRLTASVPREQYFYTGIDAFMHCFESLSAENGNALADTHSEKSVELSQKVFLADDMMNDKHREQLMIASYNGGIAARFSGVIFPLASSLGVVLGIHHGLACCYALSVLESVYPEQHKLFCQMLQKQQIELPKGICKDLATEQYEALCQATTLNASALFASTGDKFKDLLSKEKVISLYKQM